MNKFKFTKFMLEQEGITPEHLLECFVIALEDRAAVEAFKFLCKQWDIEIPQEAANENNKEN